MIDDALNRAPWFIAPEQDPELLLTREWLVTNGLGGYASGTVAGAATRRYHGYLIAALPNPLGRLVMFNHLAEEIRLADGRFVSLANEETPDRRGPWRNEAPLSAFRLEAGLPVWVYEVDGHRLEKRVVLLNQQNTMFIQYRLLAGAPTRLRLRPSVHFRPHENPVSEPFDHPYLVATAGDRIEIKADQLPPLKLKFVSRDPALVLHGGRFREVFYRLEHARGYDARGTLWSPGYLRANLQPGDMATLIASTEEWDTILAIPPDEAFAAERQRRARLVDQASPCARTGMGVELVLAADQFLIAPAGRVADSARAHAAGDETRSVIAGYHWFTDWGRDTMISLEGLTLATGQHVEAGRILRTFAHHIRNGLIPNLFPEGQQQGLYHTADATLWYFHAIGRYLQATDDRLTLRWLLPKLIDVVEQHLRGTRFGIHVDPRDGLLSQGEASYQLTWMDAKVGDWVVTPRRGKAVEINSLWYNALRLMERWLGEEEEIDAAQKIKLAADRAYHSFNERFWHADGGYLYDVLDGPNGDETHCRPNQIFSFSLDHPVLREELWRPVLEVVTDRLLTPMGLRSLAPGDAEYKPRYDGDLRSRDAAYHQGTVWAWLIGPFIDAWLRVNGDDRRTARQFLTGFEAHLGEACIGSISEVFDAEAPYTPRGCVAQAWSVAEALRAWIKTAGPDDVCRVRKAAQPELASI